MNTQMSRKTKQTIFAMVWFFLFILTVEFFRFELGLLKIALVFVILGSLLQWLLFHKRADKTIP